MLSLDPSRISADPLDQGWSVVTRTDHRSGFRLLTVELPFGISRSIPARSHPNGQPNHWLSEGRTLVGDEDHVIRVLTDTLTAEILETEARRGLQDDEAVP